MEGIVAARRSPFGDNPEVGARGVRTQQRILTAALQVFDQVGYREANVESITERAGCSRPTFYQYFASKEELFRLLAGRLGRELGQLNESLEVIDSTRQGRDRLADWLARFVEMNDENAPVLAVFSTALRSDDLVTSGAAGLTRRYGVSIADALEAPLDAPVPVVQLGSLMVTTITRAGLLGRNVGPRLGRQRLVDGLADLTHRAFFGLVADVNGGSGRGSPGRDATAIPAPAPSDRLHRPDGQATRRRLLDAATGAFAALGYHDTRVDDVVAAAGLSHGTFYRYFDDKEAVFRELSLEPVAEMMQLLDQLPRATAALGAWMRRWYEAYEQHSALFTVWSETDHNGSELSGEVLRAVISKLDEALAGRPFGDAAVDSLALLALLERGPYTARTYGALDSAEAAAASATLLDRAFFGGVE